MREAEELPDSLLELPGVIDLIGKEIDDFPVLVEEPLAEVARDFVHRHTDILAEVQVRCLFPIHQVWGLASEELENLICLFSVHLHFMENRVVDTPAVAELLLDLMLPEGLHFVELVAWE